MQKTITLLVSAALAGCAAPGTPGSGAGARYVPIIDMVGADGSRYASDLAACQQMAGAVNPATEALVGGIVGALFGAATASYVAPGRGLGPQSANYGAMVGGTSAGASANVRAQRLVINCMAGRGYRTLEGGNVVVVQSAPQIALPAQPIVIAPASPAQPAAVAATPSMRFTAEGIGQESHQVERLPEAKACSPSARAVLTNKGPGFETYTVMCSNGDSLTVRCEFGACRALR